MECEIVEETFSIDCVADSELGVFGVRVHAWCIITVVVCMTIGYPGRIGSDSEVDEILDIAGKVCPALYFRMSVFDILESKHGAVGKIKKSFNALYNLSSTPLRLTMFL